MIYWKWWQVIIWILVSFVAIMGIVGLAIFIVNLLTGGRFFDEVIAIVVAVG